MTARPVNNSQKIEVFLPPHIVQKIEKEAAEKGLNRSALMRMIIMEYYSKSEK